MRNLTRGEAQRRAELLDVASYDVHLDLTVGDDHFLSTTVVDFSCREPGAGTFLELDAELVSGSRDGRPLELRDCRIALEDLAARERVEVVARCAYSRTGEGLHRFTDPADGRTYVSMQAFLDDAQRVFACFDQPDLKAVFRVVVDAPQGWTVVGNARVEQEGCRWTFAPTEPLSTYLVHVSAGPWHGVKQTHDGIELGLWCRQSLAEHLDADELFAVTRASLDHQQRVFGRRYPFGDTYDQLFVPDFDNDAMENAGAVTFTEDFVPRSRVTQGWRRRRAMTIAHEMAHMWFGDLVTMRWWDDLWLNESFAELLGYSTVDEATRFDGAWTDFCNGRKAWGYRADAAPTTHPISGDVADTRSALLNFDGISYAKGASVLRQLQATLGPEAFFAGVRAYLDRHAWGTTSLADLLAELEAAAGRDLTAWARTWLQESGTSTLRTEESPQGLVVRQESPVLREHRIDVGRYALEGGRLVPQDRFPVHVRGARTPTGIRPADLVLLNDGDLTFAKVRFDERSLVTVVDHLADLEDPLARAVCTAALWDALRDGELPAATYLQAVTPVLRVETDPSVVETLLGQLVTAAGRFTAPDRQRAARSAVARAAAELVAAVPAGSDLQLVGVRAQVVATDDDAPLQALLEGELPGGLALDPDLRWHLVRRRAALGGLDAAAIEAELARDRTAAGERHAAWATAARPDAAGKQDVWRELTGDAAPGVARAGSLASAFWQGGQDALLERYVDRYVAQVEGLWRSRSPVVARTLARGLFPATLVRRDVLERTGTLLERPDLPVGLRRVLLEQCDELSRASAAQRVDAMHHRAGSPGR